MERHSLIDARDVVDITLDNCENEDELEDRMMREKGELVVEATWRSCTIEDADGNRRSEIRQLQYGEGPVVNTQLLLNPNRGDDQGLYICMSPVTGQGKDEPPAELEEIIKILPEGYICARDPDESDDDEQPISEAAADQLWQDFYSRFPYTNYEEFPRDELIKQVVALYIPPEEHAQFAAEYDSREAQRAALYDD